MGLFDSSSFYALENGLKGALLEQKAIAQNVANSDTPNYKAKRAQFQHVLEEVTEKQRLEAYRTHPKHIAFGPMKKGPYISEVRSTMYHHNGNNVDMDKEMSNLAKNQIYYNALTDRLSSKFQSLKSAVRGG